MCQSSTSTLEDLKARLYGLNYSFKYPQQQPEDPYDDHEYLQENFGVHFSYTDKVLAKRRVSRNGEGYLVSLRPGITQPCFKTVMNTCHFSRLVACQWWRRMLEPCTPSTGYYREKQVREKEVVLKQVGEMIEDLDRKLAGGPPAHITQ